MFSVNYFDRNFFFKLILFSLTLNLAWGFIATQLEKLGNSDKGFITGLGYLIVYGLTFFLCLDKQKQKLLSLLTLIFYFIVTFSLSSFFIIPMMSFVDYLFKTAIIGIISSTLFSAILMVLIVSKYFDIKFKLLTAAITFMVALSITLTVPDIISRPEYFDLKVFQSQSIFYTTWQVSTTIILGLGVSIK